MKTYCKHLFYVSLLMVLGACSHEKQYRTPDVIVRATVKRIYTSTLNDSVERKSFEVNLSVINRSKHPVAFWTMSCSWYENFLINNDYVDMCTWDCDDNLPVIRHVKPKDSLVYKTTVIRYDESRFRNVESTRFGFIFIDSAWCKSHEDFENILGDRSNQSIIFWSNPLFLNDSRKK